MKRALSLVLLALCGCTKITDPVQQNNYPPLTPMWTEKAVLSGYTPVQFGDLLIAQEIDQKYQHELGEVAFNLQNHAVAWRNPEMFYGHESLVLGDRLVYFNGKHQLVVINQAGEELKRIELPADVEVTEVAGHLLSTSMLQTDDLLILPLEQAVLAYRKSDFRSAETTLQPVWRLNILQLSAQGRGRLAAFSLDLKNNAFYVLEAKSSPDLHARNQLIRLNAASGKEEWRKTLFDTDTSDTPHLGVINSQDGKIFVHLMGLPFLTAYRQDGTELWKNPNIICPDGDTNILSYLVLHNDLVFVAPYGDHCYTAVDVNTGATRYVVRPPQGGSFGQAPTFVNDVMYATNGFLWAVDTKDGSIIGRSSIDLAYAQGATGTVIFDEARQQLLVWGGQLTAFKPLR